MADPYTHAAHAARCRDAADSDVVLIQYVQTRSYQTSCCARIRNAWTTADGVDLWQLELLGPIRGIGSFGTKKTTQCSGIDGRCVCAGEDPAAFRAVLRSELAAISASVFSQAGVVAPPDGLNIEKCASFGAA